MNDSLIEELSDLSLNILKKLDRSEGLIESLIVKYPMDNLTLKEKEILGEYFECKRTINAARQKMYITLQHLISKEDL